jgi:hypothetical protein
MVKNVHGHFEERYCPEVLAVGKYQSILSLVGRIRRIRGFCNLRLFSCHCKCGWFKPEELRVNASTSLQSFT